MMFWQNIKMAFASLGLAKLRSFLTMLGIIIGVSSVVTVLAAGAGVRQSVSDQVSSYGANLIQVNPGQAVTEDQEGQPQGFNIAATFGASTLTEKDIQVIRDTTGVKEVAPFTGITGVPQAGDRSAPSAFTVASNPSIRVILNRQVASGRFFTEAEDKQNVAVIGAGIAEVLFPGEDPVGQKLTIRQTELSIIGVMEKEEAGTIDFGFSLDNLMYLPFGTGKAISGGVANIIEIDVLAESADQIDTTVEKIKANLKNSHAGVTDFTVTTADDQLKLFDSIMSLVTSFVTAIAGISLLVGGIGVMNIMFVSVTERTREIGIRKAIGASNRHILSQFLVESVVLSLFGGLLGVGLALLQGFAIEQLADFKPVFTPGAFITAVVISVVVGVTFGTAPAIKASRKDPIEALRYE